MVDSSIGKPVQSYTIQSKRPRPKLDLRSLLLLNLTVPQIESALKEKLDIQAIEGSEEIKGTQGSVNKWVDKDENYLAVKIIQPKQINFHWTGTTKGEINSILIPEHPNLITASELLMASADNQFFRIQSRQDIPDLPQGKLHVIAATFPWIEGKDLFEQLAHGQHQDLIPLAINVALDMCKALEHLHKHGFVYRDLKPENIMFDGLYRLADLGFSKYLGECSTQTPCGTLEYLSLDACGSYDKRIDIWTLGVLILDIAINWTPANYCPQADDAKKTKEDKIHSFIHLPDEQREKYLRNEFTQAFSTCPELLDLACRILKKPESRPSLEDIENTLLHIQALLVARNLAKVGNDMSSPISQTPGYSTRTCKYVKYRHPIITKNSLLMLLSFPPFIRGVLSALLLAFNTLILCIPLLLFSLSRFLIPIKAWHKFCTRLCIAIAECWISINSGWMRLTRRMQWQIEGLESLQKDEWYLVTCNHQSWADIFIVQHLLNRRIPMLKFFLKQELIWVPVIGLCWWALDFPFMKRYSRAYLEKYPEKHGEDLKSHPESL